ncbi:portal protein [Candidatus Dojkabacteria bacterium]|jgi:hypothetical protein|nr:portal protein [Candidatus Dojkabacteria bacterium]
MKFSAGINLLNSRNVKKNVSKKILLANTNEKLISNKTLNKATGVASDPSYFTNDNETNVFNPDIRYRNTFAYSPLTGINYRNDLLVFAENNEIKKAIGIMANETVVIDSNASKYPVYPVINITQIDEDKKQVAQAIQEYLDKIFYPKLFQFYNFKDDGLIETIEEYYTTGKLAFEIIYDNLKSPKDIVGIIPIDPSTLQKFKKDDYVFYVQKPTFDAGKERILHENQIILIEYNKFDFGYVSYADKLRRSFNIMRSMQTSKILWFAAKSQVRMHIKLAMGDVGRPEAIQKLTEAKNQYINKFVFTDEGTVLFNGKPNNSGYREFFTAETSASGTPEMEEVNTNGPDLTEVDSLQFWEKNYWKDTEIPYDRIDPNSSDTWGFTDVNSLRKIEINFGKLINKNRKLLNQMFLKAIIIQLTLKEVEIGIDLNLLDSIRMEWIAFNEYDKMAELEILAKKIEIATNLASFGELEDANGVARKAIPLSFIIKNYIDFTPEQLESIEIERKIENIMLGFPPEGVNPEGEEEEEPIEEISEEEEIIEDDAESIKDFDDENF